MSALKDIQLPKTLPEFLSPDSVARIQRLEDLANALQSLKVQITDTSTGKMSFGVIQITGDNAVLVVNV